MKTDIYLNHKITEYFMHIYFPQKNGPKWLLFQLYLDLVLWALFGPYSLSIIVIP